MAHEVRSYIDSLISDIEKLQEHNAALVQALTAMLGLVDPYTGPDMERNVASIDNACAALALATKEE